jgi:TfoX/Sxy family transcriptional regulator of competence genes
MAWTKPSAELTALLDEALAPFDCQKKIMFGMPAFFVHGQMFAGLHQDSVILRLASPDRAELLSSWSAAAQFEPMPGRPMREYVALPESLYRDQQAFRAWLERSREYARSLPPKEPKLPKPERRPRG